SRFRKSRDGLIQLEAPEFQTLHAPDGERKFSAHAARLRLNSFMHMIHEHVRFCECREKSDAEVRTGVDDEISLYGFKPIHRNRAAHIRVIESELERQAFARAVVDVIARLIERDES